MLDQVNDKMEEVLSGGDLPGGITGYLQCSVWQCDNDNEKLYKYVCITTNQPDTKYNSNPNPNTTAKQHAVVNIQLNTVTRITYPEKFIRDNVVAAFLKLSVVFVTLLQKTICLYLFVLGTCNLEPIL